jgi:uncharacterized protein YggE
MARSRFTPGRARPFRRLLQAAFGCLLVGACVVVDAQAAAETPGKITVEGVGTTLVKPDIAEIRSTLTGSAPLAKDAEKKYREHRRRALEMLQKLNRKDVVVESRGPAIGSGMQQNGGQGFIMWNNMVVGQNNQQTTGFVFAEPLVIRLSGIDGMKDDQVIAAIVKILDTAKDAGMAVSGVQFRTSKMDASKTAAVRAAVEAARQKAELLAGLARARVGAVLSIQDTTPSANADNSQQQSQDIDDQNTINIMNVMNMQAFGGMSRLSPIVVRATVNVDFALERGK